MPGYSLLIDLMLQYALRGLDDWENYTTEEVRDRARKCLSYRIPSTEWELRNELKKPTPQKFFPMPKFEKRQESRKKSEIEHCFFLPKPHNSGVNVGWTFILFILLEKDNSLAFRFEPAQSAGCRHDYAHMQFCQKIGNNGFTPIGIPDWIPQRDPAFPLPSSNPVKLFLQMATAVHGRSGGIDMVIRDIFQGASKVNDYKKYMTLLEKTLDE